MQMLEAWGGVNGSLPRRLDARERGWGNSAAEGKTCFTVTYFTSERNWVFTVKSG